MNDYKHVEEVIWGKLGKRFDDYEKKPNQAEDIVKEADLDWTINFTKMYTELHNQVQSWNCIYREGDNSVIGIVNNSYPGMLQNVQGFQFLESLLGNTFEVETVGTLGGLQKVFGVFKVSSTFEISDQTIDQYIIVINDHMKTDKKVTVLYCPVQQNNSICLSYLLPKNAYSVRVTVFDDPYMDKETCQSIINDLKTSQLVLQGKARNLQNIQVGYDDIEMWLDMLFPIIEDPMGIHQKQNEANDYARETIRECITVCKLQDLTTAYDVFLAASDFTQHYFKSVTKAYDLDYRMSLLPQQGSDASNQMMKKTISYLDKLVRDNSKD